MTPELKRVRMNRPRILESELRKDPGALRAKLSKYGSCQVVKDGMVVAYVTSYNHEAWNAP
jgi:hypothetical protein